MRTAINENRVVQMAVLGVLAVAAAVLLMSSMGGGSGSSAQQTSSAQPAAQPNATTTSSAATAPSSVAASASPSATTSVQTSTDTSASAAPVPLSVPGLAVPQDLLASYDHNKIVVLLIVRAGGIDDAMVKSAASQLQSHPEIALYVTRARGIARYAAITQGLDVNRVPALVVFEPKVLSDGTPTARVSYGFRSAASVVQAVRDGVLGGPKVP